jgi:serine/threonine-protein kinase
MLYKMVTGILPFDGTNHNRLAGDIISKNPILPSNLNPDIDPRLEKIILKMLRKDYFERYSSAESAMDALVEYIQKPKATRAVVENKTTTKAKLGNKL